MRLKKCALSFLRKLMRDNISFMSGGSALIQINNKMKLHILGVCWKCPWIS